MPALNEGAPEEASYILTLDLGEKLEAFRRIGISAPGPHDDYTKDVQSELKAIIQDALPDEVTVETMYMSDVADEVLSASSAAKARASSRGPVVVSTCPEIAHPVGGFEVQVNRLVDSNGLPIGFGARPGFPSLGAQIDSMPTGTRQDGVVIVEDGVFSGGTVRHLVELFEERDIAVQGIFAGFNCTRSDMTWFEENGHHIDTTRSVNNVLDWVPDHDFLPLVPGGGKVLGTRLGDDAYPFIDHNGATYSIPYIQPFSAESPGSNWTSIPDDRIKAVSIACLKLAGDLFATIEGRNQDKELRLGDLINTRQRCSVPYQISRFVSSREFLPLSKKVSMHLYTLAWEVDGKPIEISRSTVTPQPAGETYCDA